MRCACQHIYIFHVDKQKTCALGIDLAWSLVTQTISRLALLFRFNSRVRIFRKVNQSNSCAYALGWVSRRSGKLNGSKRKLQQSFRYYRYILASRFSLRSIKYWRMTIFPINWFESSSSLNLEFPAMGARGGGGEGRHRRWPAWDERFWNINYCLRFTESIRCFIGQFLLLFFTIKGRLFQSIFTVIFTQAIEAGHGRHLNYSAILGHSFFFLNSKIN